MSTYLLAFTVGELNFVETKNFRVPIRIYAAASREIEQARSAVEYAAEALSFFEKAFNVPYPLPKMDFIAVPGMAAGAVENWGLISFGETELLLDTELESAQSRFYSINTIFRKS